MSKHRTRTTGWDRLLSGVLCLALALGLLPVTGMVRTAEAASHWADPYAEQLVEWGVMSPTSNFRLNDEATRAEFVAMCNRAFGYSRLGGTPFTDVASTAWYAQDIDIAYNAGYFKGFSSTTAYPEGSLTREQAAVLLARCMRLQETVGESLGFADSRDLSEWSHGLVAAAVSEGIITGYGDGSYRPFNNITRGELAVMLVRAIGNPVNAPGSHELGDVYGNVTISSSDVTLRDTVILGNLYITGGVELGNVLLENVTVLGRIIVSGGGVSDAAKSSVILRNVKADELVVDSMVNQFVTVSAYGLTDIPLTSVRSDTYLEDSCAQGYGLRRIELVGEFGNELQVAGEIKEVVNKTPGSALKLVKGTAETITIDELATNSELLIDINTRVDVLNLDVATLVTGKGDIIKLNIGANGCEVDILPEQVEIRPGLTAVVNGEEIGSAAASELSSEPRLMAGYPTVNDLKVDQTGAQFQANGLFSGNKPGTIFWAVSEMADGSVSMEDLLHNPTYGGNIYESNSGNIASESKLVYVQQINKLMPDGSYYVSAVLVDERGNRSPLKVASFNVPDNTQPAFVGDPYMSLVSCEVAQVTAMVNKSCTLYWVLLPHGAVPPTVQNFKSGSFGGGFYGYGSQSVVKNVPISITVNSTRLREKTGYDLYLWLNDFDGTMSSAVYHVLNKDTKKDTDPTFTTPDETSPVVTTPYQTNFDEPAAAAVSFAINEAPSWLYWAVVPESNEVFINDEMTEQRKQLKLEFGTGANKYGVKQAEGAGVETEIGITEINGLDFATYNTHSFKFYYMAKDEAGNYSEVKYIIIHTKDTENPTVTLSFPENKMSGGKPQADADIILTFSEQVTGSSDMDAETFLDLYNEVKRYQDLIDAGDNNAANRAMLNNAKAILAEELEKHIKLYYLENSWDDPGTELKRKGVNADEDDYGWLDLSEAVLELQRTGEVKLTLPNGKAVSMRGGKEYYFRFTNIYDDSYDHNLLDVVDANGKPTSSSEKQNGICQTDTFVTVYAEIRMDKENVGPSISNAIISRDENGNVTETDTVRVDMCFKLDPQATRSVADSVYWDMIMWCDTPVEFEVYRRIGSGSWELTATVSYSISSEGISWNAVRTDLTAEQKPQRLNEGLEQDIVHTYVIHFTKIRTIQEAKGRGEEPEVWGATINMEFSVVAGDAISIRDLSSAMRGNRNAYDDYVKGTDATVSEIGVYRYTENGTTRTKNILDYNKPFTDMRAPDFRPGYPSFTNVTSNSFTLNVMTERAGTMYYVVAPVVDGEPSIGFSVPTGTGNGSVAVNSSNDGSQFTDKAADIQKLPYKTYIPTDGADREAPVDPANPTYEIYNKDFIHFMTGGNDGGRGAYNDILSDDIIHPEDTYYPKDEFPDILTFDPVAVGTALRTVTIDNLAPSTVYYVYIVLQGAGEADVVQIYRVTTDKATPPVITATVGNLTADLRTYDGADIASNAQRPQINGEVHWAMVTWSWASLPSFFRDEFSWNGGSSKYTLREMLVNKVGGSSSSRTLFDEYADRAYLVVNGKLQDGTNGTERKTAASYKSRLMEYIQGEGDYGEDVLPLNSGSGNYIANGAAVVARLRKDDSDEEKNKYTETDVEYGVLVMARASNAGDGEENWGFAAARNIRVIDTAAPEFDPLPTFTRWLDKEGEFYVDMGSSITAWLNNGDGTRADRTKLYHEYKSDNTSKNEVRRNYEYDGTLTINFDKAVYQYLETRDGYLRRELVAYDTDVTDSDTQVAFTDPKAVYVSNPDSITGITVSGGTITLTFKGLRYGDSIQIFIGGLITSSYSSGDRSPKRLVLTFDPALTGEDLGKWFPSSLYGGFYVTWK